MNITKEDEIRFRILELEHKMNALKDRLVTVDEYEARRIRDDIMEINSMVTINKIVLEKLERSAPKRVLH